MKTLDKVLKGYKYDKEKEVEWIKDFDVYALNLSTMQFESTSGLGPRFEVFLNLYDNAIDYSEDIAEKARKENADYLLYTTDHWVIGYVKLNFRDHELYEGEIVYDIDKGWFGVITKLESDKAQINMMAEPKMKNIPIGWCVEQSLRFDVFEIVYEQKDLPWVCKNLDSLYQIAWGVTDTRTNSLVCFEHNHMEDGYPYYSPNLDENLFSFEVEER